MPDRKAKAGAIWRYALRWSLPHRPCPGPRELAFAEVPAGAPCPAEVEALHRPGSGYAVCIDFPEPAPAMRWSQERKAATRRRNLARRIEKAAPLFADELIAREIEARPGYFAGEPQASSGASGLAAKPAAQQAGGGAGLTDGEQV